MDISIEKNPGSTLSVPGNTFRAAEAYFLGGPMQLAQQQLRRKLKAVRRLCF